MEELLNVVVILPSLEPDHNLKQLVNNLIELNFKHIIIVNDGSGSEYNKYFDDLKKHTECHVVTHEHNKGKGEALKTAFSYYQQNFDSNKFHGVVTADADGQHLAIDIKKCAEALVEKSDALILGVRNFNLENIPFKSKIGNITTSKIMNLLFGEKIIDTQTGLRAISNQNIEIFKNDKGSRFEYEINMLITALNQNIEIKQIEIQTIYYENNRQTHFDAIKDSFKIYRVILNSFIKYIMSSIGCFIIDQLFFNLFINLFSKIYNQNFIAISTVLARIISANVNFKINKDIVFDSKNVKDNSFAIKYAILCVIQMSISAIMTKLIFNSFKINVGAAKIFVDIILFFVSYLIQRIFIFKRRR